ncbi:basic blue protein-like [Silene latifolia]|uniref:basic blue protein-like n=1 Tax=Silene latifolia TaxID=37657 RepID=UPI003D78459C
MGQGRSSATQVMVLGLAIIMCVLAITQPTFGASYTVGDAGGWTFHVVNWPNGKSFKAGDALAFNYDRSLHNVVAVDEAGYTSCNPQSGAKVYQTGKDIIKLNKGANYFICTFRGHCQLDMKIAVNAA